MPRADCTGSGPCTAQDDVMLFREIGRGVFLRIGGNDVALPA